MIGKPQLPAMMAAISVHFFLVRKLARPAKRHRLRALVKIGAPLYSIGMDKAIMTGEIVPIRDSQGLAHLCRKLAEARFVAIDTEFMREKTYWPILCLIQLAGGKESGIIDPMAPGMDLGPLLELLANPSVTKVFHAGRQDLDIFFQLSKVVPVNIADTQIMAMALGHGDSISYEGLVRAVLGISIDKGARFTDWSQRPLTPRQLHYAIGDVTHLMGVYERLQEQLVKRQRVHWIEEEMAALRNPANYTILPEDSWKRFRIRSDKPRFLALLKVVAAWREREAQSRNLPRQRILKDDALLELASHPPDSKEAMDKHRGLPSGYGGGALGKGLFEAIQQGKALPKEEIPKLPARMEGMEKAGPSAELLRVLLKHICQTEEVAPKLLANSSDLDNLARMGGGADCSLLSGWRNEIFGKHALDLLEGRIGLGLNGVGIQLVELAHLRP